MTLTLNEEHQLTGSGLGYQMSSYALMRALCNRTGFKYSAGKFELLALKNTFETLKIDEETENSDNVGAADIKDPVDAGELTEFLDDEQFEDVLAKLEDNVLEKLSLNKEEVVMIGDWPERDVVGANSLGIKTIFARYGDTFGVKDSGANWDIDDISELIDIIEAENEK